MQKDGRIEDEDPVLCSPVCRERGLVRGYTTGLRGPFRMPMPVCRQAKWVVPPKICPTHSQPAQRPLRTIVRFGRRGPLRAFERPVTGRATEIHSARRRWNPVTKFGAVVVVSADDRQGRGGLPRPCRGWTEETRPTPFHPVLCMAAAIPLRLMRSASPRVSRWEASSVER